MAKNKKIQVSEVTASTPKFKQNRAMATLFVVSAHQRAAIQAPVMPVTIVKRRLE